jgi:hypothetical protein
VKERMKESYIKGLATHGDPESCVVRRKAGHEVLTGARTGTVLSREIRQFRVPTLYSQAEGNTEVVAIARRHLALRGLRPVARAEPSCARTGRSLNRPARMVGWAASERPEAVRR